MSTRITNASFVALIGADAYDVLRNLLASERPKYQSFVELKELLISHCSLNLF